MKLEGRDDLFANDDVPPGWVLVHVGKTIVFYGPAEAAPDDPLAPLREAEPDLVDLPTVRVELPGADLARAGA